MAMCKSNANRLRRIEMGEHRHPRSVATFEKSLAFLRPDLLDEYFGLWDPKTVKMSSEFCADWVCRSCAHRWSAQIHSRAVLKSGCPECGKAKRRLSISTAPYKKSLAYRFPELLKEYRGQIDPKKLHARTSKMVDWECSKCGNKWSACVSSRSNGHGCEECGKNKKRESLLEASFKKSLAYKFPKIAIEYRGPRDTRKIYAGSNTIAEWECSTCSHKWTALIAERTGRRKYGCKICKKTKCFDKKKDAFLYLVHRQGMFKIGIMNHDSKRMVKHSENGWSVIEKIMMLGQVAKAAESAIKKSLKNNSVLTGKMAFRKKFDGWNEAWNAVDLDVTSIDDLLRKLGTSFEAILAA